MPPNADTERLIVLSQLLFTFLLVAVAAVNLTLNPGQQTDFWISVLVTCTALVLPFPIKHGANER